MIATTRSGRHRMAFLFSRNRWSSRKRLWKLNADLPQVRAALSGRPLPGLRLRLSRKSDSDERHYGMVLRSSLPIEVRPREGLLLDAKNCRIGHMTRLVRVGALDLAFGEGRLSEQKNATGRYVLRLQRRTAQVQCSYVLVDVGPGGQDNSAIQDSEVVDRERSRERPLIVWTPAQNVLKCDANAQANPPRYLLKYQKTINPDKTKRCP